jgi:futalosine hydrolase
VPVVRADIPAGRGAIDPTAGRDAGPTDYSRTDAPRNSPGYAMWYFGILLAMRRRMALFIMAAVENELRLLKARLDAHPSGEAFGHPYYVGHSGREPVYLSEVGVGVASAALVLGVLVSAISPAEIIMIGSAGALPDSGLEPGHLAVASSEVLSEFGAFSEPGIGSAAALGITGVSQEIPLDKEMADHLAEAACATAPVSVGRFLTVVGVSADSRLAEVRAKRFSAIAENMEGFAIALAGQMLHIKAGEIRGVSNLAGDRDKKTWDLDLANQQAQAAVLDYLRRRF